MEYKTLGAYLEDWARDGKQTQLVLTNPKPESNRTGQDSNYSISRGNQENGR